MPAIPVLSSQYKHTPGETLPKEAALPDTLPLPGVILLSLLAPGQLLLPLLLLLLLLHPLLPLLLALPLLPSVEMSSCLGEEGQAALYSAPRYSTVHYNTGLYCFLFFGTFDTSWYFLVFFGTFLVLFRTFWCFMVL